jgi:hypothetical protein
MTTKTSRSRRRALPAAVGVLASMFMFFAAAGPARAEEVFTGQAAAANATDSTWIPAPANPAAVCIVDTGVTPNPDTTNVVARFAVDGGDPDDVDSVGHHGTLMAMIASAPYNGFGMVGAAPSVKVVSVRAKRPGESGFLFSDVLAGMQMCQKQRSPYNIQVISLSLGGQSALDPSTRALLAETVDTIRNLGVSVVAAAGNRPGPADWPAAYGPVLSVAASDVKGAPCAFSASGQDVDLSAPGCPQDVALPNGQAAWASGTSEATAFVASALAQLRAHRPDLTPADAENALLTGAARREAGAVLDVETTLRAQGLAAPLIAGREARPSLGPESAVAAPSSVDAGTKMVTPDQLGASAPAVSDQRSPPEQQFSTAVASRPLPRLPRPRVRSLRVRKGTVELLLRNRPDKMIARVELYVRQPGRPFPKPARTAILSRDRLRTRISGKLTELSITYVDPRAQQRSSAALIVRR